MADSSLLSHNASANNIVLTDLQPHELPLAAGLLARAYRDNPLTFALIGSDRVAREQVTYAVFLARLSAMAPAPFAAMVGGEVIGACGFDAPGPSRMTAEDQRKIMEAFSAAGRFVPPRAVTMLSEFEERVPKEPHWHLGPVGVEPGSQKSGIGSAMLQRFCEVMDRERALAFLETDQEANERLYTRFGFKTVDMAPVLGVPMWFMTRQPR